MAETTDEIIARMTDERCDAARMQLQQAFADEFARNCQDLPPGAAFGVTLAGLTALVCYTHQITPVRIGTTEASLKASLHDAIDGMWDETRASAADFSVWPTVLSDERDTVQ